MVGLPLLLYIPPPSRFEDPDAYPPVTVKPSSTAVLLVPLPMMTWYTLSVSTSASSMSPLRIVTFVSQLRLSRSTSLPAKPP